MRLKTTEHLFHFKCLEHISGFDILEVLHAYPAFVPGHHFPDVVLETSEAGDVALVDYYMIPDETDLSRTSEFPFFDYTPSNHSDTRNGKNLTYFHFPQPFLSIC